MKNFLHFVLTRACHLLSICRRVLRRLLCTNTCLMCGKKGLSLPLCKSCFLRLKLSAKQERKCKRCGNALFGSFCPLCESYKNLQNITSIRSLLPYANEYKALIYRWKKRGERGFASVFAELVLPFVKDFVIVPVPARKGKIRDKGWDQVRDVANCLCYEHGVQVANLLVRKDTGVQKNRNREERFYAMKNGMALKRSAKGKIPKKCLVFDDIMTTGATLEACATVLKNAGAQDVRAVTLFCVD